MSLMHFMQNYAMPKEAGHQPTPKRKPAIIIVRPHYTAHPDHPQYEDYCRQRLLLHQPFRSTHQVLSQLTSYSEAYAHYLAIGQLQPSLEEDLMQQQQQRTQQSQQHDDNEQQEGQVSITTQPRATEEWMLICEHQPDLHNQSQSASDAIDWCAAAAQYPNVEESATFITKHKEESQSHQFTTRSTADLATLQGKQIMAYNLVKQRFRTNNPEPLRLVLSGTAGTGKSYLIQCLRFLLDESVKVMAPTGVAAFNVQGHTLHSLLQLPTKGEMKELEGARLQQLQQKFTDVRYIVNDEMSMVGRKMFGLIDKRLRQAFPHNAHNVLGGCSCVLIVDFGQLPPVMDLPLYTTVSRSQISDLGRTAYQMFTTSVVLEQVMRQSGQDADQVQFRDVLLRMRNAQLTVTDLSRTSASVQDKSSFDAALHLYPTVEQVVQHNIHQLQQNQKPIAIIKATHTGSNASKTTTDQAGGLQPEMCLAHGARVMLTANLWVETGLVNGALGTVSDICYLHGGPPDLPVAVMIKFDGYSGPTLQNGNVPITPLRRTWCQSGATCSRLQLPLRLSWAVTIHKSQGLTLDKAVVELGTKEFSSGLSFVACSRVRHLSDLLFRTPFPYTRLEALANNQRIQERKTEDQRLKQSGL